MVHDTYQTSTSHCLKAASNDAAQTIPNHDDDDDNDNSTLPNLRSPNFNSTTPENEAPPHQHHDQLKSSRTRGATVRLSASIRAITRSQLLQMVSKSNINDTVKFTFAQGPMWHETQATGSILATNSSGQRIVKISNDNIVKIPFDESDKVVTHFQILQSAILNIPINLSNGVVNPLNFHLCRWRCETKSWRLCVSGRV